MLVNVSEASALRTVPRYPSLFVGWGVPGDLGFCMFGMWPCSNFVMGKLRPLVRMGQSVEPSMFVHIV